MALKLGELVAYLRTDKDRFSRGLREAEGEFRASGDRIERDSKTAGAAAAVGFLGKFGKLGASLSEKIGGAFSSMPVPPPAIAAAAAIGAAMAPVLGAALAAGVLLAVGGGVLAAGIMLAAKDPKVAAAWKAFGDRGKKALSGFAEPFKGPMKRAADTFGDALERIGKSGALTRMGQTMAPLIDKLAPSLASMAEKSMPGIEKAVKASVPLFEKLAEHGPKIGEAISDFFELIAKSGPGATAFFDDLLGFLEFTIRSIGGVIFALSKMYEGIKFAWKGIKIAFAEGVKFILTVIGSIIDGAAAAFGWIPGLGPKLKTASKDFDKFRKDANKSLDGIKDKQVNVAISVKGYGAIGAALAAGAKLAGKRAAGGPQKAGLPYLVGENGPELHVPETAGRIVPNHALSRGMAAAGTGGLIGVLRVILQWPDGRVIRDQLVDAATLRGQTPGRYLGINPA